NVGHKIFEKPDNTSVQWGEDERLVRLPTNPVNYTLLFVIDWLLLKQKLFNMGFIPGVSIEMIRSAPLLDPIEIKVLDYLVVLRREEASMIEVEIND
ncbi:FeoA family protein, partial [Proteus faecis]|uniref:FeoA family protein n=1 Tax=Proteus faecis TaxID=2050967 RepID=UPI0020BDA192